MGTFSIVVGVKALGSPKRREVKVVVDTGAHLSVIPTRVLESLELKPQWRRQFVLANGEKIERDVGIAVFQCNGLEGASEVIFGEGTDKPLLGALTLESLGLKVNPRKRRVEQQDFLLL